MLRKVFKCHFVNPAVAVAVTATLFSSLLASAQQNAKQTENEYTQVNLVSSGYVSAKVTDPKLINPWGMVAGPATPIWTSNQGTNTSNVYKVDDVEKGTGALLTVAIPTEPAGPNGPTGIVFNSGSNNFEIPTSTMGGTVPSIFVFDNLNGTISGWNPGSKGGKASAVIAVDNQAAGALYTGLALGTVGSKTYLYAINFTLQGGVEVYDTSFKPVTDMKWSSFDSDDYLPKLPRDKVWRPYNIANINGMMYVAFAAMPAKGGLPIIHKGLGVVAAFTPRGRFIKILAKRGQLDAPWGMVMAPNHFGKFSNDLLVGNFGNGQILAYRIKQNDDSQETDNHGQDTFVGTLRDSNHNIIKNGFLWTLMFGNGAYGADPHTLYFTTGGPNQATDGLLGAITPAK